jgi:hypothetical protein
VQQGQPQLTQQQQQQLVVLLLVMQPQSRVLVC